MPDLTVRENLRLGGLNDAAVRQWLQRLELELDFGELVRDVPLAFQRMLDFARALATDPVILLLDEITATLPADLAERVLAVMHDWTNSGRAVVFISHRLAEVQTHCDRATVLRDGRDVASFAPHDGGERRMVQLMVGEVALAETPERPDEERSSIGTTVFAAQDVRLGRRLQQMSLSVRAGEILGIAALEGQGQDALFEVLSGSRKPDAGSISVAGRRITARTPYDAIRRGVVLVPSDRLQALLPQRSVQENLTTPLHNSVKAWGLLNRRDERGRALDAVRRLSIDTRAQSQVRRLSGGNQQKVTIGRWLVAGFRVLLCYDPTRGIDVGTKTQIYQLLHELAESGVAVVLYTSELREIPLVCDRVLVMYDGRITAELPGASADEETLLTAAHGLEAEQTA